MAENYGSSSSHTLDVTPPGQKASGGRRRKPKPSSGGDLSSTPSRVGIIPSPKGKEKALDVDLPSLPSQSATGEKRAKIKKKYLRAMNGESSTHRADNQISSRKPQRKDDSTWDLIPVAQNEVSRIPPVWSNDGRFYFTVTHTSIHIHSSTAPSFARLSTLSSTHPQGHTKPITSLHLSPINSFQVISSSEDGTIKIWDWVAGRLVRTIKFSEPHAQVHHTTFGEVAARWWIFATVTNSKDGSGHKLSHRVLRVPFTGSISPQLVGKLSAPPSALIMSPRSTYLVALSATKAYTYRMPSASSDPSADIWEPRPTCVKFVSDQSFTCGAFSPEKTLVTSSEEEWFATGDEKGVIRLWHGLAQAFRQVDAAAQSAIGGSSDPNKALNPEMEKRLPTTSLHWHAHAVSAIAFTPSGSQLLSVGEESVLVQWHLASGKREYIPRLGGRPIISLAVKKASRFNEEEWWMSLADGATIRVGSASGHIANIGQGVRLDPLRPTSSTSSYPFSLHPSTSSFVVPSSHPSTLQFIDPIASTVLFDLEVAPSNRVSRRDEKEHEPVSVEKVAFSDSQNGQSVWMATYESRKGDDMEGGGAVKNLKIWKWQDEKYAVNTQFPRPHGMSPIVSTAFSPLPQPTSTSSDTSVVPTPYLLTASTDGTAKIWHVRQLKRSQQGKFANAKPALIDLYWSCRSSFDYRGMPIYDSAFSPDGTMIVLAHGSVVTLWDVESNVLLKVFDAPSGVPIKSTAFVGPEGRFLIGSGEDQAIVVWDMLSCEVSWSLLDHRVHQIATAGEFFLTFSTTNAKKTLLTVFSPVSSVPLRIMSISQPIKHLQILPTPAISPLSLHLIGVASSGEIFRFGDLAHSAAPLTSKSVSTATKQQGLSIWQEMFGKDAFLDSLSLDVAATDEAALTATATALQQRVSGKGKPADVFTGPSHTMPPTGILFDAFMDELLSGHTASSTTVEVQEAQDDDILYEAEHKIDIDVPSVPTVQGKTVDDDEIKGLEIFFREVLGNVSLNVPKTPAVKKVNGHLPNGDHTSVVTPINKKLNGLNGKSTHGSANKIIDEDESMEVDVGPPSSGKKGSSVKGKKRKAPREE
ncbi:uncharacterized protein L201_000211 [Kwoniella dendrophila CBS 6074]|uniref:WD repeat-containing protein 75 second beta-propeller domain-containing protein n=1 Tax=Kwoniella dendrophila CBS 6074 TaxID=1295534 RepID=A0AAX4JLS3_9TREE